MTQLSNQTPYNLIGLMGGTFNPIHHGHLRMAQELADTLQLTEVRFIPSANPPHKPPPEVSPAIRAEMVKLAIEDNPTFVLDTRELSRKGASYTIDTLIEMYQEFPESALCLMMGSDAFMQLHTWHRWQDLLNYCHIVLVQRPNSAHSTGLNQALEALMHDHYTENLADLCHQRSGYITMQQVSALAISSSQIRDLLAHSRAIHYLCPKTVVDFIRQYSLYQHKT